MTISAIWSILLVNLACSRENESPDMMYLAVSLAKFAAPVWLVVGC